MITRPDIRHSVGTPDTSLGDHDGGLEHNRHWARERYAGGRGIMPVADASAARTPSCTVHDDAIYPTL